MPKSPLTLLSARASEVLGEYDHALTFAESDDFVIVYGPNGVGKTKFLEIIHALSRLDGRTLAQMPFSSAFLEYSNGTVLGVRVTTIPRTGDLEDFATRRRRPTVEFSLRKGRATKRWVYDGGDIEAWLVEHTPWRPINTDFWEDRRDGEIVSFSELEQRYPEAKTSDQSVPREFREFPRVPSYLIETQRLKIEQSLVRKGVAWRGGPRPKHTSKIAEQAAKMSSLVNDAQTEHSRITQQLDRTFPNRVLGSSPDTPVAEEEVRDRYNDQNGFRSRLGRVASVALEDALSLPDRPLSPWELQMLNLYLDDADKKLAPFEGLLQRIELLEQIVSSRLLRKYLQVSAEDGLSVWHEETGRSIDLDSLSSGEQHEVILLFDLLFNVPPGALVLIDEPEISLHVVWQLAFIPDVQRIAELVGFRFVVATHSPQIINDAWSRAMRLGPPEVEFA